MNTRNLRGFKSESYGSFLAWVKRFVKERNVSKFGWLGWWRDPKQHANEGCEFVICLVIWLMKCEQ